MSKSSLLSKQLHRLKKQPYLIVPALFAWLRGWLYRIKFTLQFKKFSAGRHFRVYGILNVSGPGKVSFGDNCILVGNAIKPICIRTLHPQAEVRFGNDIGLNGTSIQCMKEVVVGDLSAIADAYITDNRGHSITSNRRKERPEEIASTKVVIGRNVWISVQVVITAGVTVGHDSVIGACSLVRKKVPNGVFAAGNPLKIIKHIND